MNEQARDIDSPPSYQAGNVVDDDSRKSLAKHALRSESEPKLRAMVQLAKSEPVDPGFAGFGRLPRRVFFGVYL